VLSLPTDDARADAPDWSRAVIDESERQRRLSRDEDILRRLRDRDPGGDIEL
jgi:CRISPR/Cas system-associated protein Csm6